MNWGKPLEMFRWINVLLNVHKKKTIRVVSIYQTLKKIYNILGINRKKKKNNNKMSLRSEILFLGKTIFPTLVSVAKVQKEINFCVSTV